MGIEPTSTAWEAVVLPMNYICNTRIIITKTADELYPRILFTDVLYQNMPEKSSDKKGFIACDSSEYALAGV